MDLREYLFRNNISLTEFAKSINYDYFYISKVKRGVKKPGRKLAEIIEKATNGQVTVKELLKENKHK